MRESQLKLSHVRRTYVFVVAAALLAACQPDSMVGVPRQSSPARSASRELSAATTETLWDELNPVNGVLVGTPAGAVITPANDFVVPKGEAWTVSTIVLRGAAVIANPSITVSLEFRADDAGKPGAAIRSFALAAASKTSVDDQTNLADFRFDLPEPVTLRPGTYWLASQCSLTLVECGLGPVVGQQAFTTLDGGVTWQPGFQQGDRPPADNLFALVGTNARAKDAITNLVTTVAGFGLDRGTASSLDAKLQTALDDIAAGSFAGACTALQDFISSARAQAGKKLSSAQAAELIDGATNVRALLGC